jgi:hypothetical protein
LNNKQCGGRNGIAKEAKEMDITQILAVKSSGNLCDALQIDKESLQEYQSKVFNDCLNVAAKEVKHDTLRR